MTPALEVGLTGTVAGALVVAGLLTGLPAVTSPAGATYAATVLIQEPFVDAAAERGFDRLGQGAWLVAGGRYRGSSTATGSTAAPQALSIHRTSLAATSWRLEATLRPVTSAPAAAALVFDFKDAANYSFVQVDPTASRSGVFTVRSGVPAKVAPLTVRLVGGATSVVELRRETTGLKVYQGPTRATIAYAGKASLPAPAGRRVGFAAVSGSTDFDDLSVVTSSSTTGPTAPAPTPAPSTPTPPPTTTPTAPGSRAVNVSTSTQLSAALADARPGDVITLADGVYTSNGLAAPVKVGRTSYVGTFVAATSGTAASPIVLQGSRRAVIDGKPGGDGTATQYGLYLVGASHWHVKGITVTNVAKGIVADQSQHSLITGVDVANTGQEGIHLRAGSSDNVVRDSTVRLTGRRTAAYGEGIYVGSASSNWDTYTGGLPDRSDRNQLIANTITQTGAESIDVKEGTTGGLISGNVFDGATMTGSYADSWVDLKGNGWTVTGNRGTNALLDGFQVHGALAGWGNGNTFRDNIAEVRGPGYGFWLQKNVTGNVIACANTVTGAASGFANVACQ